MTSPPSRVRGISTFENLGLDRGQWLLHGQYFRYWARCFRSAGVPFGALSMLIPTSVEAQGYPRPEVTAGPPKMSLF